MRGDMLELAVTHLAGLGDGVASHGEKPVFIPLTMAGDVVQAEVEQVAKDHIRARLVAVLQPSPQRQTPPCEHFGQCGGCELQHLDAASYAEFKTSIAHGVLRQLGAGEDVLRPLFQSGAASRRRAEFKLAVQKDSITLGFHAPRSHEVVATPHCKVVDAAIAAAIPAWEALLQTLKKPAHIKAVQMTHADNGMDVVVQVAGKLKPADSQALLAFAQAQGIVRLALRYEGQEPQLLLAGEPKLQLGDVQVELPVAAFMQATAASQQAMVAEVLAQCKTHKRVADLYSGCGTFSLPLAQAGHSVSAYEGDGEAVTALFNAARSHGLEGQLHSTRRDLFAKPLSAEELRGFDAVVINPPRNGALPQTKAIGKSGVAQVVMVSCNPATFTRDAQALLAEGYRLTALTPVDQFTWSHHLELVGVFSCR